MDRLDGSWETLSDKSPEFIYRCYQSECLSTSDPQRDKKPWVEKFKEWFFPSSQAYCLPSYPMSPEKYHFS